jgi:hypothetical protein
VADPTLMLVTQTHREGGLVSKINRRGFLLGLAAAPVAAKAAAEVAAPAVTAVEKYQHKEYALGFSLAPLKIEGGEIEFDPGHEDGVALNSISHPHLPDQFTEEQAQEWGLDGCQFEGYEFNVVKQFWVRK